MGFHFKQGKPVKFYIRRNKVKKEDRMELVEECEKGFWFDSLSPGQDLFYYSDQF